MVRLIWSNGDERVCPASPPRYRHSPFSVPGRLCAVVKVAIKSKVAADNAHGRIFTLQQGRSLIFVICSLRTRKIRVTRPSRCTTLVTNLDYRKTSFQNTVLLRHHQMSLSGARGHNPCTTLFSIFRKTSRCHRRARHRNRGVHPCTPAVLTVHRPEPRSEFSRHTTTICSSGGNKRPRRGPAARATRPLR